MIEFEWEKTGSRADAAALLRDLADSLEGDGAVEVERDGWELKLEAGGQAEIAMEVEVQVDGDETEIEIELKWSRRSKGGPKKPAAKAS